MKQRTHVSLPAAVVLLAGAVIVQATQPRRAPQGGPCPADIDNSGNADVVDFLQLLGSWGAVSICNRRGRCTPWRSPTTQSANSMGME